ncbi:MAG: type II toxin-antitoxin system VapB family antitoxin [Acidimicrobiia bacterium]|nr:type II toxin-antitoxin system VapB family antitoxin [Acidimicrobiia bacterium]
MALNIKDPATDQLVRELAAATGESITVAVATAVRQRLDRVQGTSRASDLVSQIASIAERCSALPILDPRAADEILGYDEHGLPT